MNRSTVLFVAMFSIGATGCAAESQNQRIVTAESQTQNVVAAESQTQNVVPTASQNQRRAPEPVTESEIEADKRELKRLRAGLAEAERQYDLLTKARAAVDLPLARDVNGQSEDVLAARAAEAARRRNQLKADIAKLEIAHHDRYERYERERRWLHGLAPSLSIAHAADNTTVAGGSLRYLHRFRPAHTFELGVGYHDVHRADDHTGAATLRARLGFGREHVLFFVGVGGGLTRPWADRDFLALAELGLAFRVGHHTHPRGWGSAFADARLFVSPWMPFDGSPSAVLFGVELGGGIGFVNASSYQEPALAAPDGGE